MTLTLEEAATVARTALWWTGVRGDDAMLDHQWEGACFGASAGRFILGDEPGLGKTRQVIAWADLVGAERVLCIVPREVCSQFAGEFEEYSDRVVVNLSNLTKSERHRQMRDAMESASVIVVNYEIARQDKEIATMLREWQADAMIVDEAHNIKTTSTAAFKFVSGLILADNECPNCGGYIEGVSFMHHGKKLPLPCPHCNDVPLYHVEQLTDLDKVLVTKSVKHLALVTGTPLLNTPDDLYSLLHLVDPDLFPSLAQYRRQFCALNHWEDKYEFRQGALRALHYLIEPVFIARTAEDAGVVIPTNRVHIVEFAQDRDSYGAQFRIMRRITEEAQVRLDSGESFTIMHALALLTRKRQAVVYPAGIEIKDRNGDVKLKVDVEESQKMDVLIENVLAHRDRRQVIFSQFAGALVPLQKRLIDHGLRVARLDGSTSDKAAQEIKDNFYRAKGEEPKWDVVVVNYKKGGVGLNLTAATVTHILDEEWNPGKRDQAYGRTSRYGQTDETDTFVYRMQKSVDTYIARIIRKKEDMLDTFATGKSVVGGLLSREDLSKAMREGEL